MFIDEINIVLEVSWQVAVPLALLCLRALFNGLPVATAPARFPASAVSTAADGTSSVGVSGGTEARKGKAKNRNKKDKKKK